MNTMRRPNRLLVLLLAAAIGAGPALANPPSWAGGGKDKGEGGEKHEKYGKQEKHEKHERKAKKGDDDGKGKHVARKAPQPGAYFDDRNRDVVHRYYASAGHGGKGCPPGLAKKNNGCMPPGQAKKWQVGQPLPPTVVVYPVPQQIVIGLPPVPVGHKYVQVAGDILLIAVGTKMVVDGINGLASR
jgi:Ni/Co efflux regulator RcnB